VLLGEAYWGGLVDWLRSTVLAEGKIKEADLALFSVTDDPREAVRLVHQGEVEWQLAAEEEAARVAAADRAAADASGGPEHRRQHRP
jgi:predicted Rossmann-fold nucleotide-binding protein